MILDLVYILARRKARSWASRGRLRRERSSAEDSPLFDARWYRRRYRDVGAEDAYRHYIDKGRFEGRRPSKAALSAQGIVPRPPRKLMRRELFDYYRMIAGSNVFDASWYSSKYGVPQQFALMHYLAIGTYAGFDPNPFFSTLGYFEKNPDVADHSVPALVHYFKHGFREGRGGFAPNIESDEFDLTDHYWRFGQPERM